MTEPSTLDECLAWLNDPMFGLRDIKQTLEVMKAIKFHLIAQQNSPQASSASNAQTPSMNQHATPVDAQDGGDYSPDPRDEIIRGLVEAIEQLMDDLSSGDGWNKETGVCEFAWNQAEKALVAVPPQYRKDK